MFLILGDMELFRPVTWFDAFTAVTDVLVKKFESDVTRQPAPGMNFLAAVPPLRPGFPDHL
jgi:hypothetical protein